MLKEMRNKGVDLNVRLGPEAMTVLHLAVIAQDKTILRYLLKNTNARINDTDNMVINAYETYIIANYMRLFQVEQMNYGNA